MTSSGLDYDAMWKLAEELAQEEIDRMYPKEDEGIRAHEFERLRDKFYRQMAFPS